MTRNSLSRQKQLHMISTGKQTISELVQIIQHIHPYIDFLHLREPLWTVKDHFKAIDLLTQAGLPLYKLVINDRVDVAFVKGVYGVQLPYHSFPVSSLQQFFPTLKFGRSIQTIEDARTAETAGAHWLIHGHIFPTDSKKGVPPRG